MSRWRRAAAPAQVGLEICVPGLAAKGHHLPHWNWDICRAPLRRWVLSGIICHVMPWLSCEGLWACWGDGAHRGATCPVSSSCLLLHASHGCQGPWGKNLGPGAALQSAATAGCLISHPVPSPASGYCLTMAGLQILRQPQPCRLAEGDTLALECRAIGNPPPQYQWFRNRRPVEGAQAPQLQV